MKKSFLWAVAAGLVMALLVGWQYSRTRSLITTPLSLTKKAQGRETPFLPAKAIEPNEQIKQQFLDSTHKFYEHRRSVNRDQIAEQEYASRAQEADAVRLATAIVGDPVVATDLFADQQAYARVFAIGLLDYLAKQGNISPLEEAVHRVGGQLANQGSRAHGVGADYVDLLSSYMRRVGLQTIVDEPNEFFQRIGYSQELALDVEKAFYDSGLRLEMKPDQKQKLQPFLAQSEATP